MFHKNNSYQLREKSEERRLKGNFFFEQDKFNKSLDQYKKSILCLKKIHKESVLAEDIGQIIYCYNRIHACHLKLRNKIDIKQINYKEKIALTSHITHLFSSKPERLESKRREHSIKMKTFSELANATIAEAKQNKFNRKKWEAEIERLESERKDQQILEPKQNQAQITSDSTYYSEPTPDLLLQCERLENEVNSLKEQNKALRNENKELKHHYKRLKETHRGSDSAEMQPLVLTSVSGNSIFKTKNRHESSDIELITLESLFDSECAINPFFKV